MKSEILELKVEFLNCVSGGNDETYDEYFYYEPGPIDEFFSSLDSLGSDLGIWLYDFFNS